ncbi:MAG: carboxypeptidase-like regulatory domain-containing protein, partial [Bacteroidota bacterium]
MKSNYLLWKVPMMVLAAMLFSTTLYGQKTVSGTVSDSETGNPMSGVTVLLKGTTVGAITDDRGSFNIETVPGADSLM